MFATHFPVDRLLWGFNDLFDALLAILGDLGPEDGQAFFAGCATDVYELH
jgi:predicted TIM-barrel fold metal-dependent hydrolase